MSINSRKQDRYAELSDTIHKLTPHIFSCLVDEESFLELRIKHQEDGTFLGIAKQFDGDGSPIICFGSGYGFFGCMLTLDAAIQGNKWRIDKPWSERKS